MKKNNSSKHFARSSASFMIAAALVTSVFVPSAAGAVCALSDSAAATALTNSSTLDKNSLLLGDKVTLTGAATGGTGDYIYEYVYKLSTKTSWSNIKSYSADTSAEFTPRTPGTYDLCVKAKDSEGNLSKKKFVLEVSETALLKNNSTVSAGNVSVNQSVKINAKATGGEAPYRYAFYFKRSTNTKWNVKGTEFGTASSVSFTPTAAAVYDIRVDIKDASGQLASKLMTVSSSDVAFENLSTVSTERITEPNTSIKLSGKASGGQGSYKYAFYFKRSANTKWNTIGTAFGAKTSATLTATAVADYDVMISVKDETGTVLSKIFRIGTSDPVELKNESTINAQALNKGDTIKLFGAASGGVSPYTFTYQFKRSTNTTWKTLGSADTTAKSASVSNIAAAEYDLRVIVKDFAGDEIVKTFKAAGYELVNNSVINSSSVILGSGITITGDLSGGAGGCTYSYYYRSAGENDWTAIGEENVTANTATFTPAEPGSYELMTRITDGSGLISEKTFEVSVNEPLSNTSTINKTTIKKGQSVILSASAEGGIGSYAFAYYYKKTSEQTWHAIGAEFDSRTSETYVPTSTVAHQFKVVVRDDTGKTEEKQFNVTVKPKNDDELPIIPAR